MRACARLLEPQLLGLGVQPAVPRPERRALAIKGDGQAGRLPVLLVPRSMACGCGGCGCLRLARWVGSLTMELAVAAGVPACRSSFLGWRRTAPPWQQLLGQGQGRRQHEPAAPQPHLVAVEPSRLAA